MLGRKVKNVLKDCVYLIDDEKKMICGIERQTFFSNLSLFLSLINNCKVNLLVRLSVTYP